MIDLIDPRAYRRMPWKNGGGVTTEILVSPAGAGVGNFTWRVSIAEVARDGPFSPFPGIDRVIALLSGAGMRLRSPDFGERTLVRVLQPFAFGGESPVACTLIDGPIRDFNLMVLRESASASLVVLDADTTVGGAGQEVVLHVTSGQFDVSDAGPACRRIGAAATLAGTLAAGTVLRVCPSAGGAAALLAQITRK